MGPAWVKRNGDRNPQLEADTVEYKFVRCNEADNLCVRVNQTRLCSLGKPRDRHRNHVCATGLTKVAMPSRVVET